MRVSAEDARAFAVIAQTLTRKNGIFAMTEIESRCKTVFSIVAQDKGWIEKRRPGVYKWTGPEDITILVGETIYRGYRKYNATHTGGGRRAAAKAAEKKSNGEARANGAAAPLTVQISELTAQVAQLRAEVERITRLVG